jgi:hypothetical protein
MPTGIVAGDILVMTSLSAFDNKSGGLDGLFPGSTGWTERQAIYLSGDGFRWNIYTKTAGASESSVTLNGTNMFSTSVSIVAVSGGGGVDIVGTQPEVAAGTNIIAPSVTTTQPTDLLIGSFATWNGSGIVRAVTAPLSMTSQVTTSVTSTVALGTNVATETLTASGATGTRTATIPFALTYYKLGVLIAIRPPIAPSAPTSLVATPGDTTASIAFTAGSDGGSAITNYEYSSDNGSTWTTRSPASAASPVVVPGLTNNSTPYQIKLRAVNAIGVGTASAAVSVTPIANAGSPAFRSVSTVTTQTTSLTCPIPSGVLPGDILIAHVRIKWEPKVGDQGNSTYAGWTMRGLANDYYGGYYTATYSRTATGSDSSFTWTGGTNWHGAQMSIVALSGATALQIFYADGKASDTLYGLVGQSITATTSTGLLLGFWSNTAPGVGTLTPPASMTQRVNSGFVMTATAEYNNAMIATQTLSASGATGTRTATVVGTGALNFVQMIVVK